MGWTHCIVRPIDLLGQPRQLHIDENGNFYFVVTDADGESANIEDRKQTPTGKALNVQIGPGDVISNIPVFMDFDHHQLHEGETFRWSVYVSSLASGVSKDIRLVVPNITIPSGVNPVGLCPHFRFEVVADSNGQLFMYETPTFTGNGTYTSKLQIWEDPTVSVVGSLIWQGVNFAAKQSAGHIDTAESEFVLKNNTSYLLRYTSGTAGLKLLLRMVWYEDLGV